MCVTKTRSTHRLYFHFMNGKFSRILALYCNINDPLDFKQPINQSINQSKDTYMTASFHNKSRFETIKLL